MKYIVLGGISFIFLFLFDYYKIKQKTVKMNISSLIGLFLFVMSFVMLVITSEQVHITSVVKMISIVFSLVFALLLIYSLFLELPFSNTYLQKDQVFQMVDTGTYALTRHPGVLWLFLLFVSLFFSTGSLLLIPAGILWTIINIIYVILQERIFFIHMFPNYKHYQKTTPMLIPNYASVQKCFKTLLMKRGTHY